MTRRGSMRRGLGGSAIEIAEAEYQAEERL